MANDRLIAIGEALIDFIPQQVGCDFSQVEAFSPKVGGAPANVCGAFARLGGKARMLTQLGDDPFGHKILNELKSYGIDTFCIPLTPEANTALAFVSLGADGNRTFSFYRKPSADMLLRSEQLQTSWFEDVFALHFCSVSLGDYPMGKAHQQAVELARSKGGLISFDPNLRFQLWPDREALRTTVRRWIPQCDILKISDEELEFITSETDIQTALPKLFSGSVKLVIYTCGGDGAYAFTRDLSVYSPAGTASAKDTTGAGDGFIGSLLWKLHDLGYSADSLDRVSAEDLQLCLDFSSKFCAYSVQNQGAIPSYPTLDMMNQL